MNIALPKAPLDSPALASFVYKGGHIEVMRRRREWMEGIRQHMVLRWVAPGHIPSVAEAEERLEHLREYGPTEFAFSFKSRFVGAASALSCNA